MSQTALLSSARASAFWGLVIPGALILAITMGARQSMGLFVSPLNTTTGLGLANISFALAIGQFVWGATQPLFGIVADRHGPGRVIVAGALLLALGSALTAFANSQWALIATLGVLSAAGAGAGSFSILIGSAAQRISAEKRSVAAGIINAGGSLGQFIFAPLAQFLIVALSWQKAMLVFAASALLTIPLAWPLRRQKTSATLSSTTGVAAAQTTDLNLRGALKQAFADKSYLCLHAGFFTCGFHIAFLVTHLPQEVALCNLSPSVSAWSLALIGIANIVGSLSIGALGSRYRMKYLLFWLYFLRAVMVVVYLLSAKTALTFYIFAIALGLTWLATVPPTAGLVGKLFGVKYLSTLFGLTLLSHQTGGFFGAWLGGVAMERSGNYNWMWYADILLALAAALINLPIKEQKLSPQSLPA
jgi:predicted MFS family arabinose efflux permease